MKSYYVKYKMLQVGEVKGINIIARNKTDAYDKAVYEDIPNIEGSCPYSAWVHSVTYNNGNYKTFNTCEGLPY